MKGRQLDSRNLVYMRDFIRDFGSTGKGNFKFLSSATLSNHRRDMVFFFKGFGGHMSFFGATGTPVWISGDVSSGFQSQSGFCLIRYFCGGEYNVHSPRFTSGATLADLLAASAQPVTSPHACAEVGLGSDLNVQPHEQKTNPLPLCQRPGFRPDMVNSNTVAVIRSSI